MNAPLTFVRAAAVCLRILFVAAPAASTEVQRVVSPGGIEAWLVEEHSIPILSLKAAFRGGATFDPAGREGVANMTSGLLVRRSSGLESMWLIRPN